MNDESQFFLVVAPGFEKLAEREVQQKLPGLDIVAVEKGGLLIAAPFAVGLAFNKVLKIPTAVRLRIAEFKSRDFLRLFNRIQSVRWSDYLIGNAFELKVECAKSRLLNEKRVEESVREGIARFFNKQPPKKVAEPYAFAIHVRFFDDICTLSLDLSGEPLFKRGYKTLEAVAPIRENLAAALFYDLWSKSSGAVDTVIDPLCGSGTLLFEACQFFNPVRTRSFAYSRRKDWVAADVGGDTEGPTQFFGFDQSEKSLKAATETLGELAEVSRLEKANWHFERHDIFAGGATVKSAAAKNAAVICNPPYGERLKLPEKAEAYYPHLLGALVKFQPKIFGLVVPKNFVRYLPKSADGYGQDEPLEFSNGGIPVEFVTYSR